MRRTCRCSTCSTGAPVHGRADAGAVRPARGDARRAGRALPALPARDARADPRRGRRRARRRRRAQSWRRRCAARPATTRRAERLRAPRPRPARARFGCARARGAVDLGRHARGAAAARDRRRPAAPAGHGHAPRTAPLRRLERRLLAAGVRLRAGARARPGRRTACARSASTRRRSEGFDHLEPVATEAGPGRRADRLGDDRSWSGTTRTATRSHAAYRDYHGRTVHDLQAVEQRRASPTTTRRRSALAREHARDFVDRGSAQRVAERGGLLCCALDTELLGHWWYEGPAWLGAVLEEAPRRARAGDAAGGLERVEPAARELAPSTWGTGKDLTTWDSPAVGRARVRRARAPSCGPSRPRRGHAAPHAALERAARELLALQSSDWAFMVTRDLAGDYPARADRSCTAPRLDAALGALTDSAAAAAAVACAASHPTWTWRALTTP